MPTEEEEDVVEIPPIATHIIPGHAHAHPTELDFPFRQNTIARRARSPAPAELAYQFAAQRRRQPSLLSPGITEQLEGAEKEASRPTSVESDDGLAIGSKARKAVEHQIEKEEVIGEEEEEEEMSRVVSEKSSESAPKPPASPVKDVTGEVQAQAALREGEEEAEIVEDRMGSNPQENKRIKREKLSERLMEVFGLDEREEVLEEMRCWLLRSISELHVLEMRCVD